MDRFSVVSCVRFLADVVRALFHLFLEYPSVVLLVSVALLILRVNFARTPEMTNYRGLSKRRSAPSWVAIQKFDYGPDRGPHTWACCPGTYQSPINILDSAVQKYEIRELLTWNHYEDLPQCIVLENTGNTVLVRAYYTSNRPTVSGADLLPSYTFVEVCFRWSFTNSEGSEHMINHRKFPMELQAMHSAGLPSKVTSSYDLLMISYVYEIAGCNPYLEPLVSNLHLIQNAGAVVEIAPFPMSYLCHPFRSGFYSYGGSLTEPPCYQGVEWFVYPEPLTISERQISKFRMLLSCDNVTRIQRNARPVQNLHSTRAVSLNEYVPMVPNYNLGGNE